MELKEQKKVQKEELKDQVLLQKYERLHKRVKGLSILTAGTTAFTGALWIDDVLMNSDWGIVFGIMVGCQLGCLLSSKSLEKSVEDKRKQEYDNATFKELLELIGNKKKSKQDKSVKLSEDDFSCCVKLKERLIKKDKRYSALSLALGAVAGASIGFASNELLDGEGWSSLALTAVGLMSIIGARYARDKSLEKKSEALEVDRIINREIVLQERHL